MELEYHVLEWSEPTRWTDPAYQSWRRPRYECESNSKGAAPPAEPVSSPLPRPLPLSLSLALAPPMRTQ